MITWKKIQGYIRSKWIKIRWHPIHVFCLHHVCAEFDAESMHESDWMQIDEFKSKVLSLRQEGVEFISLTDAYQHITDDKWRNTKYAVLTFDDGWASIREIIPWLYEQMIPVTLFLNPAYIKGIARREIGTSLTEEELEELLRVRNGLITIASHGWNHTLCTEFSIPEFEKSVSQSEAYFMKYDAYIPFFAYPCGRYSSKTDKYLRSRNIMPVYMDGNANYSSAPPIHREILS